MDKSRTCFFTGHRKLVNNRLDEIKEKLDESIEELIENYGINTFITGGALGFDMLAAESVIEVRVKYPGIKLLLYLPCHGHSSKWRDEDKYRLRMIMSKADGYEYITPGTYTKDCMRLRNLRMVRDSSFCVAFCILANSGTGLTLKNAEAAGLNIINIDKKIY